MGEAKEQDQDSAKNVKLTASPERNYDKEIRSVPKAIDVEKSVLALMATDPATYIGSCITMGVTEEYFYLPAHQLLWKIFSERYTKNEPVDIISVTQRLQDKNELESVGGIPGLAEIYSFTTTGAFFQYHIGILRDKYVLRSIIAVSTDSIEAAYSWHEEDVPKLLDSVESSIFRIRERLGKEDEKSLVKVIDDAVDRLEVMLASKGEITGLSTGFDVLDGMSNGLKGGDMFVVAARPSMGKTSFLLNIIEHMALDKKQKTLMFSCEMPSVQIVERLLFARSGVKRYDLKSGKGFSRGQMQRFQLVVKELKESSFVVDDTAAISINELRAKARRVMRDLDGLDVIGIDYLQLMRSHSKQAQNSREREIAEISAGLKSLAKELNVPVIVLAQLNRGPENRTGKSKGVPQMSDLRESGAIEQDADMIGLLYRSAYYAEDEEDRQKFGGRANLYLAKNRNGATGDVPLHFEAELMRFTTRERDEHDPEE